MKNGILRFIPLQADLCLNKQKVDIEDFKGWQKCNAPVYGDCLSPLYKKENTHHDIYIGNDVYDFSNGILYKNGNAVLGGSGYSKIKKTKITDNYKTLKVTGDNVLTWARESTAVSFYYSLHGSTSQEITLTGAKTIIDLKAFGDSAVGVFGIVALYLASNGKTGYFIVWREGGEEHTTYGESSPTLWSNFDVVSPLIQVGIYDAHNFLVSIFSNSGAEVKDLKIKNIFVKNTEVYETVVFKDINDEATRYMTIDDGVGVKITVDSFAGKWYGTALLFTQAGQVLEQTITIELSRPLTYPITVVPKFLGTNGEYSQRNNKETFTIAAGTTKVTRTMRFAGLEKMNAVGGREYKYESYNKSVNGGNWTDVSPTVNNEQMYGCYVADINGAKLPTLVFDLTYTSDKDPEDPVVPQDLVSKTVRIGEILNETEDGYVSNGLIYNTYISNSKQVGAYPDMGLETLISQITNAARSYSKTASSYFINERFYVSSYGTNYYFDSVNFDPYLATGQCPLLAEGSNGQLLNTTMDVERYIKQSYQASILANVDCCIDGGLLYNASGLPLATGAEVPTQLFALSGTFSAYDENTGELSYESTSSFNIAYNKSEANNVFPRYYEGMNISISNYLLRTVYKFKAKKDDTDFIYIMIDSVMMEADGKGAYINPGVTSGTEKNLQGATKNTQTVTGWRFLFNNNLLSNISCYERSEYIGTILADWFTIDESFCPTYNNNLLYYKDNQGNIWKLEFTQNPTWEYKVVENRYIVLNTTTYYNCYDVQTGLKRHWASDYNNRVIYGYNFSQFIFNEEFKSVLTEEKFNGLIITGQNANYEVTQDTITGLELGAIPYISCLSNYINFPYCSTPYSAIESIDLYRGDDNSTSAVYRCSYANGLRYINTDLTNPDAVYPISENGDIRYNPNLFTEFIASYNNKDMVISDGIAYRLAYYNNVIPVMAYYLLDGVESLLSAFVLQTSYYGVSESRLYQMNYNNGVGVEVVADITNMEYLGALPSQALFWSAQNRAIYSFKGNCIMTLMQYANDLTHIYGKWYNPATQELFLDTNIGILVFSDLGTYCLEWQTERNTASVKDIFFFSDYFIVNLKSDSLKSHYYSYNNKENYESNGIYVYTKYYGNGLVPITVNNVYIRLYNQNVANAQGTITFKGHTITDVGTSTDEKTVAIGGENGESWDTPTDTMLVKYTPQYNRGLGFALEIKTTFPIIDIKFDYVENGSIESQIAHINI